MRRPRLGPRIADALLVGAGRLQHEAKHERMCWGSDDPKAKELDVAASYIKDLAEWYRPKGGEE